MSNDTKFKVGDLVFYRPTAKNNYADGTKQLGVVVEIIREQTPLFLSFPEQEIFEYEYKVKWINSGQTSILLYFNLEKLKVPEEKS